MAPPYFSLTMVEIKERRLDAYSVAERKWYLSDHLRKPGFLCPLGKTGGKRMALEQKAGNVLEERLNMWNRD